MKKFKYTPEVESKLIDDYARLHNEGIPEIAASLGVTDRSVIAKLVQLGKYEKDVPKATKPRDDGPSKKEILKDIQDLHFDVTGLEGASKDALRRLKTALSVVVG